MMLRPFFRYYGGGNMNLKKLRSVLPCWKWSARRMGFDWAYVGRLGDRLVECIPCGHMGPYEDSSETVWYVYEGATTSTLEDFCLREESLF